MTDRAFIKRCEAKVREEFSIAHLDEVRVTAERYNIGASHMVVILSKYSIIDRLRVALPLLAVRNPGRKFTHRELGAIVYTSCSRVTKSLARLRAEGVYGGEITNTAKGGA